MTHKGGLSYVEWLISSEMSKIKYCEMVDEANKETPSIIYRDSGMQMILFFVILSDGRKAVPFP